VRRCAAQTEDYSSANSFMVCGVDNAFSLDDFKGRFSIDVTSLGAHSRPPHRVRVHVCVHAVRTPRARACSPRCTCARCAAGSQATSELRARRV
jgi:hypothetical protein